MTSTDINNHHARTFSMSFRTCDDGINVAHALESALEVLLLMFMLLLLLPRVTRLGKALRARPGERCSPFTDVVLPFTDVALPFEDVDIRRETSLLLLFTEPPTAVEDADNAALLLLLL